MHRSLILLTLLVFAISSLRSLAQSDVCANPTAPRVGIITGPQPKASDAQFERRTADVELRFSQALTTLLGPNVCVVHDSKVFSDAKNFPDLKGSMLFHIEAQPSLKNEGVAAISVRGDSVRDIYAEHAVPIILTLPILIEKDADYDTGAQKVLTMWHFMVEKMTSHPATRSDNK